MSPDPSSTSAHAGGHLEALRAHPWIRRAEQPHADHLTVTANPELLDVRPVADGVPGLGELVTEHLEHWQEVYDWTYQASRGANPPDRDTAGWLATDTGAPFPAAHMAEWADRTVALILQAKPARVLELGCGTGMLLHRLHGSVEGYIGTDIAPDSVDRLSNLRLPGVWVVRAAAHETTGPAVRQALDGLDGPPDCVVLNSVTQCFPSVDYLTAVVHDAVALVAAGGTVVIGDIRHAGLFDEYCRWAELASDPDVDAEQLAARMRRRAAAEREMLLDPQTLAAVAGDAGRPVRLSLHPKALTADTELTRYRFDAVLHVEPGPRPPVRAHSWTRLGDAPVTALVELVRTRGEGTALQVVDIPNALLGDRDGSREGAVTAHQLSRALDGLDTAVVIDAYEPARLGVVAPGSAAALPPEAMAGLCRAHEPIGGFVRTRLVEVARRALRTAGHESPGTIKGQLPSGPWQGAPDWADVVAGADLAGRAALGSGDAPVTDEELAGIPPATRQFDQIALQALTRLMARSGALDVTRPRSAGEAVERLGTAPRHAWIVRRWLAVLEAEGRVRRAPAGGYLLGDVEERPELAPTGAALEEACAALGYPETMVTFYREALTRLPQLLDDTIMAQALLFPDGDMVTSLSKDQNNLSNSYLNAALGHVLGVAAATRSAPLRVVELGGGAGGSTGAALRGLAGAGVDYLFTDVSRFFTLAAQDRFGDRAGIRYGLLDINADLVAQGVPRCGVDVVVAANVLHCAVDASASLRWIRELLAPGGLLVLTEAIREHYLVLATMQFLLSPREGEPNLGTRDRRGSTPGRVFLTGRELPAELGDAGLRPVLELPHADSPLAAPAQHLFVAVRTPGPHHLPR